MKEQKITVESDDCKLQIIFSPKQEQEKQSTSNSAPKAEPKAEIEATKENKPKSQERKSSSSRNRKTNKRKKNPSIDSPQEIPLRGQVNRILRSYCEATGFSYQDAWNLAQKDIYYRHSIDVKRRAEKASKKRGKKVLALDIIEELGLMPELLKIVTYLFGQIPEEKLIR